MLYASENPNALPESDYPYWPSYQYLGVSDLDTIKAQPWIEGNHIINEWDWSLPNFVAPSPRSIVGVQRNLNVNQDFIPMDLKFKSNGSGILWVKWRDIEKSPGQYDFEPIINRIKQANSVGLDIILRILCHSKSRAGDISKGEAPLWLEVLGVPLMEWEGGKTNQNFDPSDPLFHEKYLKLIHELSKTGIPDMVKAAYAGYASNSYGDEGIGPYGEANSAANDTVQHVRERLDAWQDAFRNMEYKVFMGGSCEYGFQKGFGVRRGFVEMYLYNIPNSDLGQYVDENGYLSVDENAPVMKYHCFNGEVNEEYEEAWATDDRSYRFGNTTNSFPYRYFTSTLRALQMRCTYIHTTGHLMPKMLPFMSLELGRTAEDTPDAWCFLRTSYLNASNYTNHDYRDRTISAQEKENGIETKNFERWLSQRDAPGYETQPAVEIQHAIKMWMVQKDRNYDFIARKGKQMGFYLDERLFPDGTQPMAVKISYYDGVEGTLSLIFQNNKGIQRDSVITTGEDKIKTATFFVDACVNKSTLDNKYSFILSSSQEIPVAFVRVIKTKESYESTVSISIENCPQKPLNMNDTLQINASIVPLLANDQTVYWSSSNQAVAKIDENGILTALSEGTATIFASTGTGQYDKCTLSVLASANSLTGLKQTNPVRIFPDPSSNELLFKFDEIESNRKIRIFTPEGRILFMANAKEKNKLIKLPEPANIIIVEVRSKANTHIVKIPMGTNDRP